MSGFIDDSHNLSNKPGSNRPALAPQTSMGRWALIMTLIAIALWWILPNITRTHRDTIPITDTWVMPVILTIMTDTAAVLCVLALWRKHERSLVILIMACIMIPAALFVTLMVIGEGLAGV